MTREEAKQLLPFITAFAEGENIEYFALSPLDPEWRDNAELGFNPAYKYRIKPKPVKGWVNIYRHESPESFHGTCSAVHPTKEQADKTAGIHRIACVEIEIPA